MVKTDVNGFVICPKCGKRTKTKISPDTEIHRFPLYCGFCKRETYISNKQ